MVARLFPRTRFTLLTGILAPSLMMASCTTPEAFGSRADEVVYGEDDRLDVYEHPSEFWRNVATQSIVALVDEGDVDMADPENVRLAGRPLGFARRLCASERFRTHPTAANCSGTLIDHDLVLTAGHCVTSARSCASTRFVFDYLYEGDGMLANITADDVYSCGELLVQDNTGSVDYAIIRLDRVVGPERSPAPVRMPLTAMAVDTPLVVLGFGSGIPLKIDDGGEVTNPRASTLDWFGANLDTFGGNSGSGVFDAMGNVVGVLVRGEGDYDFNGRCNVVRLLPEEPAAGIEEECTYVGRAVNALCAGEYPSSLCGAMASVCQACRGPADCPDSMTCTDNACLPSCAGGEVCPGDTVCEEGGVCAPPRELRCDGNDVVSLRCGRAAGVVESCGDGTFCEEGRCSPIPPGGSCADPRIIAPENQDLRGRNFPPNGPGFEEGTCGGNGPESVIQVTLGETTRVRLHGRSTGDSVVYIRTECSSEDSEIACDDDGGPDRFDSLIEQVLPPGTYYFFQDNWGSQGERYALDVQFSPIGENDGGIPDAGSDAGSSPDSGAPFTDAGLPSRDSGMRFDAGPRDGGGGFDAAPGFDAGPRSDSGVEVQLVRYGCDCRTSGGQSAPWAPLLALGFVVAWRRQR